MADISYTRTTWADGQEGGTAIDATKLNNIEQGIVDAVAAIGPNDTTGDGTLKAQIDENTSDISDLQDSVARKVAIHADFSNFTIVKSGHGFELQAIFTNGDQYRVTFTKTGLNAYGSESGQWSGYWNR